jgi:hypothetical protein
MSMHFIQCSMAIPDENILMFFKSRLRTLGRTLSPLLCHAKPNPSMNKITKSSVSSDRDVIRPLAAFAGAFLALVGVSPVQAQWVTVNNPVEAHGALTHPPVGFRPGLDHDKSFPHPTLIQRHVPWNAIENHPSDSVQKIGDCGNAQEANLPPKNVNAIPRAWIAWNQSPGNEAWPTDLRAGDGSSLQLKHRAVRWVCRLAEVWNNDPRVAWVHTGTIGRLGEQKSPVWINQDGWSHRFGDAWTAAVPEPTSALAGQLLTAGLLLRHRA